MMTTQGSKYQKTIIAWITAMVLLLLYSAMSHAIVPVALPLSAQQTAVAPSAAGCVLPQTIADGADLPDAKTIQQ